MNHEKQRLLEYRNQTSNWKRWGPYLSERAWGTVREDYSGDGNAWNYFPHDHARSRVYRWNEDGLAGISERNQQLCFALALWNSKDAILKERLFGLTGHEGNHGEDVKEAYFYLDSTPTHSYMKMLYKYPQQAFPYEELVTVNAQRSKEDPEFELLDTGIFAENRYFDVFIEYAKADQDDILIKISIYNRAKEAAPYHLLPQLWFRNTWSWGYEHGPFGKADGLPKLSLQKNHVLAAHNNLGNYAFYAEGQADWLFTNNESNLERLYNVPNTTPYVKDAFHRYLIQGDNTAVNPAKEGTKMAAHFQGVLEAGEDRVFKLRLCKGQNTNPFADFDHVFTKRIQEADDFYAFIQPTNLNDDIRSVQRQAFAGMLWSKQLYAYDIKQWLKGDPAQPAPPPEHRKGRNKDWEHLSNFDIISMPDKWEYPWYAGWDLAFHCIPLVLLDADFAKRQLELITREWYMHPNGQLPAYEWALNDVNPPVHAWAALRVYQIDAKENGKADRPFLEGIFHKLLLNFTWWVNRKDEDGHNIFQGGFLGLDNISVFDRSAKLPTGGHLDQSDGTAWMGFYSLEMMKIALELAKENAVYQDIASKFFEHFLTIAHAMNTDGEKGFSLWDEEDGFFYDALHLPDDSFIPLKVRSLVGLMPLIAVEVLEPEVFETMPDFARRVNWFLSNRPEIAGKIADIYNPGSNNRSLMALVGQERLLRILNIMLNEEEFLSPFGIRSLSKYHKVNSYGFALNDHHLSVDYEPAESRSGLFGGNSNWRGPIWFPINYLLIEALQRFHYYCGDELKVEFPTGSGKQLNLWEVATELSKRMTSLFLFDQNGQRPVNGGQSLLNDDPLWRNYILFYEYFHGDNGAGLGASHQTGWTGLVAKLIQQSGAKS